MRAGVLCLTLALVIVGCRGEAERPSDAPSDTTPPVGTGTELLLTRERLELIDGWVRAAIARDGKVPGSLDDVRPPEADAERYVPLGHYLRDGWGRAIEYQYTPASRSYELRSPGEDAVLGNADDVIRRGRL